MTDIVPPGSIAGILTYWLAPPLAETATPVGTERPEFSASILVVMTLNASFRGVEKKQMPLHLGRQQ
jgi:hypothetical protein